MALSHRRITASDDYVVSLGYAVYAFTYLEWAAIYIVDTLKPNYIRDELHQWNKAKTEKQKKPAGLIARDLKEIIQQSPAKFPMMRDRLLNFQKDFSNLTKQRNMLLHANPYMVQGEQNEQRLQFSNEQDWPIEEIDNRARRFEIASVEAVELRLALIGGCATVPA